MLNNKMPQRRIHIPAQLSVFKSRASTVKNIEKAFKYVEKNLMGIKVAGDNVIRRNKINIS